MNFQEYINLWTFANNAYKGSGGFSDGSYIDRYPRESDEKYKNRKEIAHYINLFAPKVNRYIGYIFKSTPMRSSNNTLIKRK